MASFDRVSVSGSKVNWVAVLGDTHSSYVQGRPDPLTVHANWLKGDGRYVQSAWHCGDFFNDISVSADRAQVAASGFPLTDRPCVWTLGNHDCDNNNPYARGMTVFNSADVLPPSKMSGLAGAYSAGSSGNTYSLVNIGDRQWLVMALEFGPPDAVVTWADGVLSANPTLPTAIVTHSDLYRDGTLTDATKIPAQEYLVTGRNGGQNYGQQLWTNCFSKHPQVGLVMSGHDIDNVHAYLATAHTAGGMFSRCHHIVNNFQGDPQISGNAWMVLLGFDYNRNRLLVRVWSPHYKAFKTECAHDLTLF